MENISGTPGTGEPLPVRRGFLRTDPKRCLQMVKIGVIPLILLEYRFFVEPEHLTPNNNRFPAPELTAPSWAEEIPAKEADSIVSASPIVCRPIGMSAILKPELEVNTHAASFVELPDERLLALWYSGTREGAKDVKIWSSCGRKQTGTWEKSGERNDGKGDGKGNGKTAEIITGSRVWSKPEVFLNRERLRKETHRYIRKLGNPLLFVMGKRVYCWIVSASYGGWSGSSINFSYSDDSGKTWSRFRRLRLSPIFNLSNLVRTPPVSMTGNRIGFPFYHELARKYSQFAVLNSEGRILQRSRIPADEETIQPVIAVLDSSRIVAVMRNCSRSEKGNIKAAESENAGKTWYPLPDLAIPNPDNGIALAKTADGQFFLAANLTPGRHVLDLFGSDSQSPRNLIHLQTLENEPDYEFSYPLFCLERDGTLDLVYTWKRQGIKFLQFDTRRAGAGDSADDSVRSKEEECR